MKSREECCKDYGLDSVHSVDCETTGGVYCCEECDAPFGRVSREQRTCEFCRSGERRGQ